MLLIARRARKSGRPRGVRILVQAAPARIDLHVWTLTSEMDVASAHVMVRTGTDAHTVLDQARDVLAQRHGLAHATVQVEPDNHEGCNEMTW